jgi:Zn finger protein HypA/HybF involved in hydrogenase expression
MHELSLAVELVAACRERAQGRAVREVLVRCPASVDLRELSEAFALVVQEIAVTADDACLVGCELRLERVPVVLRCPCGYQGKLTRDDIAGHMTICPGCGQVGEAAGGLELVNVSFCEGVVPFGPHLRDQVP